jgi:hypothetical protein
MYLLEASWSGAAPVTSDVASFFAMDTFLAIAGIAGWFAIGLMLLNLHNGDTEVVLRVKFELEASIWLIDDLIARQQLDDARAMSTQLVQAFPRNLRARLTHVRVLRAQGCVAEAESELRALLRERPGTVEVEALLAELAAAPKSPMSP